MINGSDVAAHERLGLTPADVGAQRLTSPQRGNVALNRYTNQDTEKSGQGAVA